MITDNIHGNIYIIHAKNGYEYHEERIRTLFAELSLPFEFVTEGDPTNFTKELLHTYFIEEIETILSPGTLSCTLNHFLAYKRMLEKGDKYALILENDPCFLGDFTQKLSKMSKELSTLEKSFIISLENTTLAFPSYWETKKDKHFYQAKVGRMAGAYIIDAVAAQKILDDFAINKCNTIIDWWHNKLIERNVIKMYWAHPPLIEQGSHNGIMNSTISSKPKSLSRRFIWLLQKYSKMYGSRLFKQRWLVKTK